MEVRGAAAGGRADGTNLILTDYIEFRWYVAGQHRMAAHLVHNQETFCVRSSACLGVITFFCTRIPAKAALAGDFHVLTFALLTEERERRSFRPTAPKPDDQ